MLDYFVMLKNYKCNCLGLTQYSVDDGMRVDKRLVIIPVLLIVLSMVVATQYATTQVGYSFSIAHPSNADIRYVACDYAGDGIRLLRVAGDNSSTDNTLTLSFGNVTMGVIKTYSAAFAIVNEESFAINITHVTANLTTGSYDNMLIWLHGDGSIMASDDPSAVLAYNNGTALYDVDDTIWPLARGDRDTNTMTTNASRSSSADTNLSTPWDETAHVRYCNNVSGSNEQAVSVGVGGRTVQTASDFVWVQVAIDLTDSVNESTVTGTISFHFEAGTHYGEG